MRRTSTRRRRGSWCRTARLRSGSGLAVNATETLLAGSLVEEGAPPAPGGGGLEARWAAKLPMALYTIDIASGVISTVYRSTDWLNHVQFSPTDPTLLMFCHEGPWHKLDRIWTIRTDGTGLTRQHARQMDMEIAGHEFFSADGRTIWYDLQTPKSEVFWLAGVNLARGQRTRYRVARAHWSVHFNISPDGTLFAGDGGGPASVAAPGNGQWIYLFTPGPAGLDRHTPRRPRRPRLRARAQRDLHARRAAGSCSGRTCTAPRTCTRWRLAGPGLRDRSLVRASAWGGQSPQTGLFEPRLLSLCGRFGDNRVRVAAA